MKKKLVIGFRAHLVENKSKELVNQIKDAIKYFPEAIIFVAACGDKPSVELTSLTQNIDYYNSVAIGLTPTWDKITKFAQQSGADNLIIIDGDNQHKFSEVYRVFRENSDADIIIPERTNKFSFESDKEFDGLTLEDLENAFVKLKYPTLLFDLQVGLFIFNSKQIINSLDFSKFENFLGDLSLYEQILRKGHKIVNPSVNIRKPEFTLSSRDLVFRNIEACESHFNISLEDLSKVIIENPKQYLHGGRLFEISKIISHFRNFKNQQKAKNMKGLILAGGHGTGMRPITHALQKQLIPLANKPILYYAIEDLAEAGIKDIGIIVGPNKEQIKKTMGEGSRWNVKITYIEQDEPKGLAHAVLIAEQFIGNSDFIMYLGDNIIKGGIKEFVNDFNSSPADASLLLTEVNDPSRFGIAKLNDVGEVEYLIEKPKNPPSNMAITGIYALRNSIFEACRSITPSDRGELEITDALQWLLEQGGKIFSHKVKYWWQDTGKPDALLEANQLVMDYKVPFEKHPISIPNIRGKVILGKDVEISKSATIRGPVIVGGGCKIGGGVFIGPYTAVGDNVKLDKVNISHSIIMDGAIVDTDKTIMDSIIGCKSVISSDKSSKRASNLIICEDSKIVL